MQLRSAAVTGLCLVCLLPCGQGFLQAADYSDYSEDLAPGEDVFEDLSHYEDSPYDHYDDSLAEEDSQWSTDSEGEEDAEDNDYDSMNGEPEDLDTFFWSDHLEKFGGSAVKEYENAAQSADLYHGVDSRPTAEFLQVPPEIKAQVDIVAWWTRGTLFHKDYWPVDVVLDHEGRRLASTSKGAGAEPDSWAVRQSRPGWPHLRLIVKEAIPADETILALPLSVVVMDNDVATKASPARPQGVSPSAVLAAWLLWERAKGEESKWAAFLKLLPNRVHLPFLWNKEQLEVLDFVPAINKVREQSKGVEQMYSLLDSSITASATLEEFKSALSVVWSREVLAPLATEGAPRDSSLKEEDFTKEEPPLRHFLVPFGDLTEQSFTAKASWQVKNIDGESLLCLTAESDIEEGSAIDTAADEGDSTHFLLFRGTIPNGNPHDEFIVFGAEEQVVHYFAENFIRAETLSPAQGFPQTRLGLLPGELTAAREQFKERVVRVAEEVVELVMPTRGDSTPPYTFSTKVLIDPRLWAVYAVCSFYKKHINQLETMDLLLPALARLSVDLSSQRPGLSCSRLMNRAKAEFPHASAEALGNVVGSIRDASVFIKELTKVWIGGFSTSYQDDQRTLANSHQCTCEADNPSDQDTQLQGCPPACQVKTLTFEHELAIRFRMNRKHLLLAVNDHLEHVCKQWDV